MKKVIGIVGMPGSGKSTALKVASDFGEIFVMGDVIREEAKRRGLEPTGENLGMVARELRERYGKDVVARRILEKIAMSNSPVIFIDGIRSMDEVRVFRESLPLVIVAIIAEDELRYKWLMERGRSDDSVDIAALKERDRREINFGIKEVIARADYTIQNDSTIEELEKRCRQVLEKIIQNE